MPVGSGHPDGIIDHHHAVQVHAGVDGRLRPGLPPVEGEQEGAGLAHRVTDRGADEIGGMDVDRHPGAEGGVAEVVRCEVGGDAVIGGHVEEIVTGNRALGNPIHINIADTVIDIRSDAEALIVAVIDRHRAGRGD